VLGGTFDPVHRGHLAIARVALECGAADRVLFAPAARNPHKSQEPVASDSQRLAMLRLALGTDPRMVMWDWELTQAPPSYTWNSVDQLRREFPGCELSWIIGADQLPGLHRWHRIADLVQHLGFLVMARPGTELTIPPIPGLRARCLPNPPLDIAASAIRAAVRSGMPVDNWVEPAVIHYLTRYAVYAESPTDRA
jgi:nicotinate-nucleotide adenylyltransferase